MATQCAELPLKSAATEAGAARAFIRSLATPWQLPAPVLDDLELAASELVTNAVIHACGEVHVAVHRLPDGVRLEVEDAGETTPVLRVADHEQTSGRGLAIVAALARAWGVQEEPGGKRVWALFAT